MTPEELRHLIDQPESPSLEFKRELHRIFDKDKNIKDRHRDEFIRDILSLANGNTTTAGEKAYLIIGVEDDFDPDSGRVVRGITKDVPTRRQRMFRNNWMTRSASHDEGPSRLIRSRSSYRYVPKNVEAIAARVGLELNRVTTLDPALRGDGSMEHVRGIKEIHLATAPQQPLFAV
jgi:hypothetical protein